MDRAHLAWEPIHLADPDGGSYILWPHLPCIESPAELRPKGDWNAIAILASSEDIWRWEQEFSEDRKNPGAHLAAAMASGTSLGRYLADITTLDLKQVSIPDPEPMRLVDSYPSSKIFPLEPPSDDSEWADLMVEHADQAAKASNLISLLGTGRRWRKARSEVIPDIATHPHVDSDMGAAAASAAAWWREEQRTWKNDLDFKRDIRQMSRLRGAMVHIRSDDTASTILVPVHQARLQRISEVLSMWPDVEYVWRGSE